MRKTPEIPRDVFFGGGAAEEPTEAAATPRPTPHPVEESKVQVTIYLPEMTAKRLEILRFYLLNEHNVKVSKSAIAEYAINQLNDDLTEMARFFRVGER